MSKKKEKEPTDVWVLMDANYFLARNYHAIKEQDFRFVSTTCVYYFLKQVEEIRDLYGTDNIIACFDCGGGLRRSEFPEYKANRDKKTHTEEEQHKNKMKVLRVLRDEVLPEVGIQSYFQLGYEADDVIASLCDTIPAKDEIIIASSDKDMYQLLSKRVSIFKPIQRRIYGIGSFLQQYETAPCNWPMVKAIGGDPSDNIKGLPGIGIKTACKFVRGELDTQSKEHKQIVEGTPIWEPWIKCIQLPYPGTKKFYPKLQVFNERQLKKTRMKYGVA